MKTHPVIMYPAQLPDPAIWQRQKDECEWCCWMERKPPTSMHCKHPETMKIGHRYGGGLIACIEARDEGRACGPDGKLWKAL